MALPPRNPASLADRAKEPTPPPPTAPPPADAPPQPAHAQPISVGANHTFPPCHTCMQREHELQYAFQAGAEDYRRRQEAAIAAWHAMAVPYYNMSPPCAAQMQGNVQGGGDEQRDVQLADEEIEEFLAMLPLRRRLWYKVKIAFWEFGERIRGGR